MRPALSRRGIGRRRGRATWIPQGTAAIALRKDPAHEESSSTVELRARPLRPLGADPGSLDHEERELPVPDRVANEASMMLALGFEAGAGLPEGSLSEAARERGEMLWADYDENGE